MKKVLAASIVAVLFASCQPAVIYFGGSPESLTATWNNPWENTTFYESDCLKDSKVDAAMLETVAKNVEGPDARVVGNGGACILPDGKIWVFLAIWRPDGNIEPPLKLLLIDKEGNMLEDRFMCNPGIFGGCDLLGMKDDNLFFRESMGDGGGSRSAIMVLGKDNKTMKLQEINNWMAGTTDPLVPLETPCQEKALSQQEKEGIEARIARKRSPYDKSAPTTVRGGSSCSTNGVTLYSFRAEKNKLGLGLSTKANTVDNVVLLGTGAINPHFIQPPELSGDHSKELLLAIRDVSKTTLDMMILSVNPTMSDYQISDQSSHSIETFPKLCTEIRCIDFTKGD